MWESLKILVLNSTYEPLQFCAAKRAILLVLTGRAEKIECDGFVVRSPTTSFQLPTVIRVLNRVQRIKKNSVAFSKKNILRRDNYTCQYCGDTDSLLTIDHIIPKSRGGKTSWANIVVACKACNLKKGSRTDIEAGMKISKIPSKPNCNYLAFTIPSGPQSHIDAWVKYLPQKLTAQLTAK
jgi:5-methylcytosine-specific restriction endonuclease McrA